ncbi:IS66 family insertion sequence element accessory protein TnpB [Alkalihalobacillus sp. LMS39]|uniref:IS66 family insertion sequence element accessory protein TnpA n=1 Tax=Alkalihalobacillus sp. LMS39 TaxID=2924032 RepID=UPI001FB223D9|nr:IS66 family insertion sequence element accessory protein TnpB [Alkalihalobacillus sp. LMS39]UOE95078.1 IS66 family insertion sequence element accessory protein TnpB [Alkalihalobacillus sp. LMS39]
MSKKQNTELYTKWKQLITELRTSGQTQKDWCKANNVSIHNLKYWIKKVEGSHKKDSGTKPKWVPIRIEEPPPKVVNDTIQVKVGQATIDVKPGFDPDLLRDVVKALNI